MDKKTPEFCDFDCPYAGFPPAQTAGICRTMSAVWCRKLEELTNKNTACEWRKRRAEGKPKATAAPTKRKKTATPRPAPKTEGNAKKASARRVGR